MRAKQLPPRERHRLADLFRYLIAPTFCLVLLALPGTTSSFAQNKSAEEFPPTIRTEIGTSWKLTGTVTATNSRPLSGVKVYLTSSVYYNPMSPDRQSQFNNPVTTDFSGKFEIDVKEGHLLTFVTNGFAPLAVHVPDGSALDVEMETGRTITGTVTTPAGEPMAGSIVTPVRWYVAPPKSSKPKSPTLSTFEHRARVQHSVWAGLPENGKQWAAITDSNGNFSISNVPSDIRVGLSIKSEGWKEEIVFVRPQDDVGPPTVNQILLENGFQYSVEPCSLLKIIATDESGTPAKISKVAAHANYGSSNDFILLRTEHFNSSEVSFNQKAQPRGSKVYVEPENRRQLLSVRLDLKPNDDIEIIEKEISFETGSPIQGRVVNEATGEPIEGVRINWIPKEPPKETSDPTPVPTWDITTDRDGNFSFAVPDVDATVAISGDIPGYCSMPNVLGLRKSVDAISPVFERLTKELEQGKIKSMQPIEFRLNPSYGVDIKVLDESGRPASNAVLTWSRQTNLTISQPKSSGRFSTSGFGYSHGTESFTANSDQQGRVQIDDFYKDEFFLEIGKAKSNDESISRLRHIPSFYPISIQAFSIDGFKQGQAIVPLPGDELEGNLIPLTISLLPGANILGQVVDDNENGIADLTISARSGDHSSGQLWTTKTREDGWFKMQGIPPGAALKWSLDQTRVKASKLEIAKEDLIQGQTTTIEPIVATDYSMLAVELPEIEIGGLSNDAALEVLVAYIKDYHALIPEMDHQNENRKFVSRSSSDPVPSFNSRVAYKVIPSIKKLAEREPGSDFELRVLVGCGELLFYDPWNTRMIGTSATNFRNYCHPRLLKHHADKKEAQLLLVDLADKTSLFGNDNKAWKKLLDASPFEETKAIAAIKIAIGSNQSTYKMCANSVNASEFDVQFSKFEDEIQLAKRLAEHLSPEWKSTVKFQLDYHVRSFEFRKKQAVSNSIAEDPGAGMSVSRLEKVGELYIELNTHIASLQEGD